MTNAQIGALLLCAFIGWFGSFPLVEPSMSRGAKKIALVWMVVWLAPPLVALYLTAVMG